MAGGGAIAARKLRPGEIDPQRSKVELESEINELKMSEARRGQVWNSLNSSRRLESIIRRHAEV